jgi:hypothetical protein
MSFISLVTRIFQYSTNSNQISISVLISVQLIYIDVHNHKTKSFYNLYINIYKYTFLIE